MKLNFFAIFLIVLSSCDSYTIKGRTSNPSTPKISEQQNIALNDKKIKAFKKVKDAQELHDKLAYDLAYKTDFQTAINDAKNNINNAKDISDIKKLLIKLSNATRIFMQADRMQAEAGYQ